MTDPTKADYRRQIETTAGRISTGVYEGQVCGFAFVWITKDGNVHTDSGYEPGNKFPLLGGVSLLQSTVLSLVTGEGHQREDPIG